MSSVNLLILLSEQVVYKYLSWQKIVELCMSAVVKFRLRTWRMLPVAFDKIGYSRCTPPTAAGLCGIGV